MEALFRRFEAQLRAAGCIAKGGQIVQRDRGVGTEAAQHRGGDSPLCEGRVREV